MRAIYKRELESYFHSFIGALFIGATLFLLGIYFSVFNLFMGYPYIGYALSSVVFLFLISVPLLTMRILADERKQKTDQLILTAPVSVSKIVAGKFLALVTIFGIPVIIISIYPVILSIFGEIAFGENYLAIAGFFLYGVACISIGVFVSSLVESQVIAAVLTFGILFLGYVMSGLCNMISSTGNWLTKILSVFDMVGRYDNLLNGSLQVGSVVYYLSVTVLFLIFTVQSIQKRRYSVSVKNAGISAYSASVTVISIVLAVFVNIIVAQLPSKYTVFDVTSQKLYTLTEETKSFVADISEDINVYVLANESQADMVLDTMLKNYEELNSHIQVSYVDPAVNPKFFTNYTDSVVSSNSVIVESAQRSRVIDYGTLYQTEFDYTTYSSVVTGYDGEGQITSAIAYVVSDDMPRLYILEGHGELAFDTAFEEVISKANIDYQTINLMNYDEVPEDADCVAINAPTEDLSSDDTDKMLSYMEKGGSVLLVSTYTGKALENFNRLLDYYGVEVTTGLIIEEDQNYYYQNPFWLLPEIGYDEVTEKVYGNGSYVFVPYAQGLSYTENDDVEVSVLLETSENCFVREDIENAVDYTRQEGDLEGPFKIGLKCVKQTSEGTSTALIYSGENIFTQEADEMVSGSNQKLFSGTLGAFADYTDSITIPVKNYEISYLTISQKSLILIAFSTVILIPFIFLIGGFFVWFNRRKL